MSGGASGGDGAREYRPIQCGLHDELELRAMRRSRVPLRYRGPGGEAVERVAAIHDVRTRDGAEYLVLDDGEEIRLDRLQRVDGISFDEEC